MPNSIAITSPAITAPANAVFYQRDLSSGTVTLTLSGTYTGTPTAIEYAWSDGAFSTLVASPSGGVWSGNVTLPMGQILDVRFANDHTTTATITLGVGDIYVCTGQSNNVGHSTAFTAPSPPAAHPRWVGFEMAKDGNWKTIVETSGRPWSDSTNAQYGAWPTNDGPNGSEYGSLSTQLMAVGIIAAFCPAAVGSTAASGWTMGSPPGNTGTLFGAALTRANNASADGSNKFKAFIHYQGEQDVNLGTSGSSYTASITNTVDNWHTQTGRPTILCAICASGETSVPNYNTIHAAQVSFAGSDTNVAALADMANAWASGQIHFGADGVASEAVSVATILYNALRTAFYPFGHIQTPSGGMHLAGSAAIGHGHAMQPSGGMHLAGAAVRSHVRIPSGGFHMAGNASFVQSGTNARKGEIVNFDRPMGYRSAMGQVT